jgi:DNA-binding MarR family transcriptional regulator
MKALGVTPAQFSLMTAIRFLKEPNINALSQATKTDRTTINRNLKPLVKEGLVAFQTSDDKRNKVITMLAHGDEIYHEVYTKWKEAQCAYREQLGDELWEKLKIVLDEVNLLNTGRDL